MIISSSARSLYISIRFLESARAEAGVHRLVRISPTDEKKRVKAACDNALALAHFLWAHPRVSEVRYPGLDASKINQGTAQEFRHGYGVHLAFRVQSGHCFTYEQCAWLQRVCPAQSKCQIAYGNAVLSHIQELEVDSGTEYLCAIGLEKIDDLVDAFEKSLRAQMIDK